MSKQQLFSLILFILAAGLVTGTGQAETPLVNLDAETLRRSYHSNQWQLERSMAEYRSLADEASNVEDFSLKMKRLLILKNKIDLLASDNAKLLKKLDQSVILQPSSSERAPEPEAGAVKDVSRTEDWLKMDSPNKETYVYAAFGRMEENGILMMKPPFFYVKELDRMTADAQYKGASLDNLLLLSIYEAEPHARPKLRVLLTGFFPAART